MIEPDFGHFEEILDLVRDGLKKLSDLPQAIAFFYDGRFEAEGEAAAWLATDSAKQALSEIVDRLTASETDLDAAEVALLGAPGGTEPAQSPPTYAARPLLEGHCFPPGGARGTRGFHS